ncbi:uncharacterized protein LOC115796315 isoform X2 [Archocentrus centrarchus]|uniref:uncharacterized protein LOC115796315 isoform X2 n=1 Tax=Archocentrus centrarchus TaxID=63155 RepID=UPI0011E9F1F4|nr:uncharacterized protein LOC115796315 isoform X2 [Archocentrus centrarchus]
MFYIVEFYKTHEVEVVPAAWVADDICQWPSYYKRDKLVKAIKNEEQPGMMWEEFKVRILYKAAKYTTARLKLPQAETNTDLQTAEEGDVIPQRKRKRQPNIRIPSDSDSDTPIQKSSLPPAPKIQQPGFQTSERRAPSPQRPASLASPRPTASPHQPGTSRGNELSTAAILRRLVTNQELIMEQLKIITLTLSKVQGQPGGGEEVLEKDIFPLKDISTLLAVEKRVREEADFKQKMITALSVIGGVNIKDTVWRIMKNIFTNSLAKQLNWRGVNGKTAFHSLQLKDVIAGTVRRNHLTATATEQEVETFIKRWLHLAGDRDGGRREREEKRRCTQLARPDEDEIFLERALEVIP